MTMLRAGHLSTRASVQARTQSDDAQGGGTIAYITIGAIWCRPTQQGGRIAGRENIEGERITPRSLWEVECRPSVLLREDRRLVFGTTTLNIVGILSPDGDNIRRTLICEEVK
jgi:head-tail adaptor